MAISEAYSGTLTTSGSEQVLNGTSPETTDGIYQLVLDLNASALGDVFEVRIKEKVISSGTQRAMTWVVADAQGSDQYLWMAPAMVLLHGWDMTVKQTAGSARSMPWSIRKVA